MMAEKLARRILEHSSVPTLLIDRSYRVAFANPAAAEAHAESPEDLVGRTCYAVTHGLDEPCWISEEISCPVRMAFESGERARALHHHPVGDRLVVEEIVATPLDDGRLVLEEFRDITRLLGLMDGFLPVCASCKSVRDERGEWQGVEGYIHGRTGAEFTHTVCPVCMKTLYSDPDSLA